MGYLATSLASDRVKALRRASNKAYRERDPERTREQRRAWGERHRASRRGWYDGVMRQVVCVDCGLADSRVLEWHHRDGNRIYGVVQLVYSARKTLIAEMEKCDVLCANCHKIRHHDR